MSSERQLKLQGDFFLDPLSPREKEVLIFVGRGYTNPQIARTLFIAPETVKSHIKHILQKLQAATRAQAVVVGLKTEQISMSDLSPSFPAE